MAALTGLPKCRIAGPDQSGPHRFDDKYATCSRRRRLTWTALAVAGFVAVVLGAWAIPRSGVTEANYLRINEGITREEVEAILGDPSAGRASSRKIIISPRPGLPPGGTETRWRDNSEIIFVQFDKNEIVIHKSMNGEPDPLVQRIRTRIRYGTVLFRVRDKLLKRCFIDARNVR